MGVTPDPVSTCDVSVTAHPESVSTVHAPGQSPTLDVTCDLDAPAAAEDMSGVSQDQCIPSLPCRCLEKQPKPVVAGNCLLTASPHFDTTAYVSCTVAVAARHIISPVCTWRAADVDHVRVAGFTLVDEVQRGRGGLPQQLNLFGQAWRVDVGEQVYRSFDGTEFKKELEQCVLRDGMCVLTLHDAVMLVIHHNQYWVVVDCGKCNESDFASDTGRSTVVFNTFVEDLKFHIEAKNMSLSSDWFGVSPISVKCVDGGQLSVEEWRSEMSVEECVGDGYMYVEECVGERDECGRVCG